ncbi:Nucleolar and coiled-body phosphoprotein 1 [Fasciola hepatica]|uniref:Nucleolar and coiled-body phosphoprotein 1 n=1 Tax=Fasciola hepatica TaxID=6192 RepID=A0A4E0R675_FASHE|nr:Nucleolar and coiled-body phosphoprotein 1 [Fasciola hepatica]
MEASTNSENSDAASNTDTEQPQRVRLRGLQLLSSRPSELIKNGAEVSRILHQCNAQAPENAPWMDVIVPLSADGLIHELSCLARFIDVTTDGTLLQFALSDVVCCAKGSAELTNRSLFITHVDQLTDAKSTPDEKCNESAGDAENSVVTASASTADDAGKSTYRMHVVRCRTTYEASRLMSFISKRLRNRSGKSPNPLSPEYGTIGLRLLLDIREEDRSSEQEWKSVPKEKSEVFKLRAKTDKRLVVGFTQTSGLAQIAIEHCLDVSVAYGRYISDAEYTSLGSGAKHFVNDASSAFLAGSSYSTFVHWPSNNPEFHMFDTVTGKGNDDEVPVVAKKPTIVKPSTPLTKVVSGVAGSLSASSAKGHSKRAFGSSIRDGFSGDFGVGDVDFQESDSHSRHIGYRRLSAPFSLNGVGDSSEPASKVARLEGDVERRRSVPFRRVPESSVAVNPQLCDNSFDAKPNARGSWGERAHRDFKFTQGKTFKHEKTKKKRGSYFGGSLSTGVSSYKFED